MELKELSSDSFRMKHTTAILPLPVHRELKQAAVREKMSSSDLIRKLVFEYLRNDAPRRRSRVK